MLCARCFCADSTVTHKLLEHCKQSLSAATDFLRATAKYDPSTLTDTEVSTLTSCIVHRKHSRPTHSHLGTTTDRSTKQSSSHPVSKQLSLGLSCLTLAAGRPTGTAELLARLMSVPGLTTTKLNSHIRTPKTDATLSATTSEPDLPWHTRNATLLSDLIASTTPNHTTYILDKHATTKRERTVLCQHKRARDHDGPAGGAADPTIHTV